MVHILRHGFGLSAFALFEEDREHRLVLAVLDGPEDDGVMAEGEVIWDFGLAASVVSSGRPVLANYDTPRPARVPYARGPRLIVGGCAVPLAEGFAWADRGDGPILEREFKAIGEAMGLLVMDRRRAEEAAEARANARLLAASLEGVRTVLESRDERLCLAALCEATARETQASDVIATLTQNSGECIIVGGIGPSAQALLGRTFDPSSGLVGLALRSGAAVPTSLRWHPTMRFVLGHGADIPVAPGEGVMVHPIGEEGLGALVLVRGDFAREGALHAVRTTCEAAALLVRQFRMREAAIRNAMYDGLTGLYNRTAFMQHLSQAIALCNRHRINLSLLMLDADHFKRVNDEYGHQAGDVALRFIADTVRRALREYDFAGRYGGEEMAVALPHTDARGAAAVAERIRGLVAAAAVPFGSLRLSLTVSIGVATLTSTMRGPEDLIAVADAALYAAKGSGRNRVVVGP